MNIQEATEIYKILRQLISWPILDALHCLREPHKPKIRTCKWEIDRPQGAALHYTAGASGLNALRWFNDPKYNNEVSSAHVLIFDRMVENTIGEMWEKLAETAIKKLFPVPTLILADWAYGTWCTNWINDRCLGIENRNVGYDKGKIKDLGKTPLVLNGLAWEPFTREQIVCNINILRLLDGWIDNQLNLDLVLPHSAVSCVKMDTGLAFPLNLIRNTIKDPLPIDQFGWLAGYEMAPDSHEDDEDTWLGVFDDVKHESPSIAWVHPSEGVESVSDEWAAHRLYLMGYNCGPAMPSASKIKETIGWFQRSTAYYVKVGHPEWVLDIDGVCGPATKAAMERRLQELHINVK